MRTSDNANWLFEDRAFPNTTLFNHGWPTADNV